MIDHPCVHRPKKLASRKRLTSLWLFFFIVALACSDSEPDYSSVDGIVDAVYAAINFKEWEKPDLERYRGLLAPEAQLIKITKDGVNKMNPGSFVAYFLKRIESGEVKSFHESEVSRRTNAFGNIAQVFSVYKKGINTQDEKSFLRGINSFQLYNDGKRWWISSIVWQDLGDVPKE